MNNLKSSIENTLRLWYLPLLIGLFLLVFGIYMLSVPETGFLAIMTFVSLAFIISGILETFFYMLNRRYIAAWGWHLGIGLLTLILGLYLLANPINTAFLLALTVAFIVLLRSIQGLIFSFRLKDRGVKRWYILMLMSALGILIALVLAAQPMIVVFSLIVLTALSFIFAGIIAILFSILLKKIRTGSKRFLKRHL